MSTYNKKHTSVEAMSDIDIGDYLLYTIHKPDTKLDYVWKGPGVILTQVSPLVYEVKSAEISHTTSTSVPRRAHDCFQTSCDYTHRTCCCQSNGGRHGADTCIQPV